MIYEIEELQQYIKENAGSLDRIFDDEGQVDWRFLNRVCLCLGVKGNPIERELAALERFYGKGAALRKLAALGIIKIEENSGMMVVAGVFRRRREARSREHSLWGRGRRTTSR